MKMTSKAAIDDASVKEKLKKLLSSSVFSSVSIHTMKVLTERIHNNIDSAFRFEFEPTQTYQLQILQESAKVKYQKEGTLFVCDIKDAKIKHFLGVLSVSNTLYIREGYDELYDDIQRLWKVASTNEVILTGNEGTGKSFYQVYIIRRLLHRAIYGGDYENDDDDYDFIFRQVGNKMYLIDLKDCCSYRVVSWDGNTMQHFQRCLFLFEPGTQKDLIPEHYGMPSLLTISPCRKQISEFEKGSTVELYFWPWSFVELKTMIDHLNQGNGELENILIDDFKERWTLFGGIVRRHLESPTKSQQTRFELTNHLVNMDLKILQSAGVTIDRNYSDNKYNVNGYILCFDGKRQALETRRSDPFRTKECYFNARVLNFTSLFVREKAREMLDNNPLPTKMEAVLNKLSQKSLDLSGLNLKSVVTEFVRNGNIRWNGKKAGVPNWFEFPTKERKVIKTCDISGFLMETNGLLVPTNALFPIADMVYSGLDSKVVCVFRCTWQPTYPFTVRELYNLRVEQLRIDTTKKLGVIMIAPGWEISYGEMSKDSFLQGSITDPFNYKKNETVSAEMLQTMWSHTEIFILHPMTGWEKLITDWLSSNYMDIQNNKRIRI